LRGLHDRLKKHRRRRKQDDGVMRLQLARQRQRQQQQQARVPEHYPLIRASTASQKDADDCRNPRSLKTSRRRESGVQRNARINALPDRQRRRMK